MVLIELDKVRRESIRRASDLMKEAGWPKKAATIQDLLEKGQISIDYDLLNDDPQPTAVTYPGKSPQLITLNPNLPMQKGSPAQPLGRNDPELVTLAGTLIHEADHAHGHGEIEAYGEQIDFYQAINEQFKKYFPDSSVETAKAIEDRKKKSEANAEAQRKKFIKEGEPKHTSDK